jgi:CheY-like chemotaxis protein
MLKDYILIAEDDEDDQFLFKSAFSKAGSPSDIHFVQNGMELVDFFSNLVTNQEGASSLPQFILLDLNMPRKDGRETLQFLKEHPLLKKIPVVIFSTTQNKFQVSRCYELGANSYVVKPLTFDDLVRTIRELWYYWCRISIPANV